MPDERRIRVSELERALRGYLAQHERAWGLSDLVWDRKELIGPCPCYLCITARALLSPPEPEEPPRA